MVLADVFTAVVKLEFLIKVEQKMVDALGKYMVESMDAGDQVPDSIVTFLSGARSKNEDALQPNYIENPINAFHFLKRMAFEWPDILKHINCEDCIETQAAKNFNLALSVIRHESKFAPEAEEGDISGAAVALVRLWHTYKLDLPALFRGKIYNTTTDPLTPDDIYYICRVLDEQMMYHREILWLEELVRQIDDGYYTGKTSPARAYRALAGAYSLYGMPWKSQEILDNLLQKEPDNKSVQRDKLYYEVKTKSIPKDERTLRLQPPSEDLDKAHYEALCRGDIKRPERVTSKLKCFLKPTLIPFLFGKEEVLNYDPRVSMFHDVITEFEQQLLKNKVLDRFVRSTVVGPTADFTVDKKRVSQTAWLHDSESPKIRKFTHRIQLYTGLSTRLYPTMSHAEDLQVLNYGIGGMYEPHPDWFGFPLHKLTVREADPDHLKGTGDRVATWLTYLNPVKAGGATVFLGLDITVPVVKGAAAFWYNIQRNGLCDSRTWHAGCPVLIGSKWAANKWFRETGSFFIRKCGKKADALDGPLP